MRLAKRALRTKTMTTKSTLCGSIVATIKERVITWQYPPEHRLTEEALSREFNVSRSPVREALRVLATSGLITRMANRGYAVRQVNFREVEEIYEVRLALELYAVETLASRGGSREGLALLSKSWEAVRNTPENRKGEDLAELDTIFHESLVALVGNETLLRNVKAINERLVVFRMIDFRQPDRLESTCAQHLDLIERIEAKDIEGARAAIRMNIDHARQIVGETLKEAVARAYATL
jgi:DNA-binding GntR family transcriptional regulator